MKHVGTYSSWDRIVKISTHRTTFLDRPITPSGPEDSDAGLYHFFTQNFLFSPLGNWFVQRVFSRY
jgi:hypothetical protein